MRIAYFVYWDLDAGDGVAQKVAAQLRRWTAAGHRAEAVAVKPAGAAERLRETRRAVAQIARLSPDLVYLRYDLLLPPAWRIVGRWPTVVELNGLDLAEFSLRGRPAELYARFQRRAVLGRAAGLVAVTNEIAASLAGFRRPIVVVANGADPERVPWTPAPRNERPRAVFAGSPNMAWHGVDRLLEIAAALPWLDVDLLGPEPRSVPPNVTVRGRLDGAEYFELLGRADVAFGSLAMERAGLREGCPLKVREYLLAGLPVVVGYDDTDFLGASPWYLLKSTDPAEIGTFVRGVLGRRVERREVEPIVSADVKEDARLRFLAQIAVGAAGLAKQIAV